ncbi:MAG: hypothetical protein CME60_01885 [Halobacteriovoraceae bacterium]|nr:hypothetical protein [Halobacteriovoraceae bacterium]
MQNQTHESNNKNISFNIDEFDIESYDFKPVTKGLGFHGEKESPKSIKVSEVKLKSNPARNRQTQSSNIPGHLNNTPAAKPLGSNLMSGIDAIYNREQSKSHGTLDKAQLNKREVNKEVRKEGLSLKIPSYGELITSYIIDLLLVSAVTLSLFVAFYAIVFKQVDLVATLGFVEGSWDFFAVFFGLVYLSYFTILGPIDSLGKRLFNISQRDEKNKNERASIRQSFINAFISLFSIPLLFVPVLFDFHNKIAGIKSVKIKSHD